MANLKAADENIRVVATEHILRKLRTPRTSTFAKVDKLHARYRDQIAALRAAAIPEAERLKIATEAAYFTKEVESLLGDGRTRKGDGGFAGAQHHPLTTLVPLASPPTSVIGKVHDADIFDNRYEHSFKSDPGFFDGWITAAPPGSTVSLTSIGRPIVAPQPTEKSAHNIMFAFDGFFVSPGRWNVTCVIPIYTGPNPSDWLVSLVTGGPSDNGPVRFGATLSMSLWTAKLDGSDQVTYGPAQGTRAIVEEKYIELAYPDSYNDGGQQFGSPTSTIQVDLAEGHWLIAFASLRYVNDAEGRMGGRIQYRTLVQDPFAIYASG